MVLQSATSFPRSTVSMILTRPLKPCKPLAHRNTTGEAKSRPSLPKCETWVGLTSVTFVERNHTQEGFLPKLIGWLKSRSSKNEPIWKFNPLIGLGPAHRACLGGPSNPSGQPTIQTAFKLGNSTADIDNGWHEPVQLPYLAVHHPLAHCLVLPLKEQPDNTTPRDATERHRLESTGPWDSWLVVLQMRNWSPDNNRREPCPEKHDYGGMFG